MKQKKVCQCTYITLATCVNVFEKIYNRRGAMCVNGKANEKDCDWILINILKCARMKGIRRRRWREG